MKYNLNIACLILQLFVNKYLCINMLKYYVFSRC